MKKDFYGKYRGTVTDNNDPLMIGRVKAKVPDVFGEHESGWAMPCAPFGGDQIGFFAVPAVGAGVWIEFEQGDSEYPIWAGCWWGSKKEMSPPLMPTPGEKVLLKTEGGQSILVDDTPGTGGITLETADGQKIMITGAGIEINNGQGGCIKLSGPKVTINDGALEVI